MKKYLSFFLVVVLLLFLCGGRAWGVDVDAWWNSNYDHRKKLSCGNHGEYSTNDFLHILEQSISSQAANGDDIRIVYQTTAGQTDIGRYLRGIATLIIRPEADDGVNQWTASPGGDHYANIDEIEYNDADGLYSLTQDYRDDWNMQDVSGVTPADATIDSVKATVRFKRGGDGGLGIIQFRIGNDSTCANGQNPADYATYDTVLSAPGGRSWSRANLDSLVMAAYFGSQESGGAMNCSWANATVYYSLAGVDVYWKVQATIPEDENIGLEDDYKYYVYYDYSGAGSPETYTNVDCINAPYTVDDNTVALWHGEENAGTIYDETTNDNDGTRVGATYGQTGKFGKCLEYDGTDDYVWVDWYEDDPPSAAITIDFWVYPDRDTQIILGFNEDHVPSGIWDRGLGIDGEEKVRWKVYEHPSGPAVIATSTTTFSLGDTWYHVAGVIDVTEGLILYINGIAEDTAAGTDGGYMGYTHTEFLMGLEDGGGWGLGYALYEHFDGKIDEVRISDVTRTNFNHVTNEATLTLGSEESEAVEGKPSESIIRENEDAKGICGGGIVR